MHKLKFCIKKKKYRYIDSENFNMQLFSEEPPPSPPKLIPNEKPEGNGKEI